MTDLVKAVGQDVPNKTPQKLHGREGLCMAVFRSKRDLLVCNVDKAAIGHTHPVCVSTEVLKDMLSVGKGWLHVNIPANLAEETHQMPESFGIVKVPEALKVAVPIGVAQCRDQAASKEDAHGLDVKEKSTSSLFPIESVERKSSRRDKRVGVGMVAQVAGPRVEDQGRTDGPGQAAVTEFEQRLARAVKQSLVDDARCKHGKRSQLRRHCEDHVEVSTREHALPLLLNPLFLGRRLTLWTMAIAT